jgi:hypothetical protein
MPVIPEVKVFAILRDSGTGIGWINNPQKAKRLVIGTTTNGFETVLVTGGAATSAAMPFSQCRMLATKLSFSTICRKATGRRWRRQIPFIKAT